MNAGFWGFTATLYAGQGLFIALIFLLRLDTCLICWQLARHRRIVLTAEQLRSIQATYDRFECLLSLNIHKRLFGLVLFFPPSYSDDSSLEEIPGRRSGRMVDSMMGGEGGASQFRVKRKARKRHQLVTTKSSSSGSRTRKNYR